MDDKAIGIASKIFEHATASFSFERMSIILIISLAILKVPQPIFDIAGVSFSQHVISGASFTFIVSLCTVVVRAAFKIGLFLKLWVEEKLGKKYLEEIINDLTVDEFNCLMMFFFPKRSEVILLNMTRPIVVGLMNKGILFPAGTGSLDSVPFQISNYYKPYLFMIVENIKKDMMNKDGS